MTADASQPDVTEASPTVAERSFEEVRHERKQEREAQIGAKIC